MFDDYKEWTAFQETAGGLPANIFGYIAMNLVKLFAIKDTRNPAAIAPQLPHGKHLEPDTIPTRSAERPQISRWPVPQRVREAILIPTDDEYAAFTQRLETWLTKQREAGNNVVKGKAFDSLDAYFLGKHELFHIHPVDKSLHCMLDTSDAKLLVEKGWAEWFGIAGRVGQKPGTVLVYAPRSTEEMDIMVRIWDAAISFAKDEGKAA